MDADPAVGLSTALGVDVKKTIDDVRKEAVDATQNGKMSVIEILGNAEYSIEEATVTKNGFSFIAIGRPESAGCYCKINTYLKDVIGQISSHYDFVVIDGEAGIEQINRRVMEKVTHLLLVTDQSQKGRNVVATIKKCGGRTRDVRQSRRRAKQTFSRSNGSKTRGGRHRNACLHPCRPKSRSLRYEGRKRIFPSE